MSKEEKSAAETVLKTDPSLDGEQIIKLKSDLESERAGRKKEQTRLAELEDENRRLKSIPAPAPAPAKAIVEKKSWLDGATFLS